MKNTNNITDEAIRAARAKPRIEIPEDMSKGMKELLEMHSVEEMWFLNESLGLDCDTPLEKMMKMKLNCRDDYNYVLNCIWEGIVTEYLKTIGQRVRQYKDNPRRMAFKYW